MNRSIAIMVLSLVAACSPETDLSYDRPGLWTSTGVNDANLHTMIDNPADLQTGHAAHGRRGAAAAAPVARLNADKPHPLPAANTTNTLQVMMGASPNALGQ
jgi:hypothetical protein